jgi:hypothetical protein
VLAWRAVRLVAALDVISLGTGLLEALGVQI